MAADLRALRRYLLARLQEASTWRGIVLLSAGLGSRLMPDMQEAIVAVGLVLAGAVGAAFPDRKPDRDAGP